MKNLETKTLFLIDSGEIIEDFKASAVNVKGLIGQIIQKSSKKYEIKMMDSKYHLEFLKH